MQFAFSASREHIGRIAQRLAGNPPRLRPPTPGARPDRSQLSDELLCAAVARVERTDAVETGEQSGRRQHGYGESTKTVSASSFSKQRFTVRPMARVR